MNVHFNRRNKPVNFLSYYAVPIYESARAKGLERSVYGAESSRMSSGFPASGKHLSVNQAATVMYMLFQITTCIFDPAKKTEHNRCDGTSSYSVTALFKKR